MGRIENPNLKNDYERACGWYGHFNKSEMALFSECTDRYAQKMLDTADIVRDAMFQQPPDSCAKLAISSRRIWPLSTHDSQGAYSQTGRSCPLPDLARDRAKSVNST